MTDEIRAPKRDISPPQRASSALLGRRWFSLFTELVLIVAGILIALYIDGWVQDRKDRESETAYLELLRDDLVLIEAELEEFIEFQKSIVATGKSFLDAVSTTNPSGEQRPLQSMLSEMSVRRTLSIDSAAYADLTSTGNLQLIRDPDLRRALVSYFADTERSELIMEKNSKQYVDEVFVRYLLNAGVTVNINQSVLATIAGTNEILLETLGPDFAWPRDLILRQPRNASSWDDLRRQVLFRMRMAATGQFVGTRMIESTQQLRSTIEGELQRRDTA